MKLLLLFFCVIFINSTFAQIPKSGTYTYNYCDEEYNHCMGKCKIKIKGNKVWVYAPANLSGIKEGELYMAGVLIKHKTGNWMLAENNKDKLSKIVGGCEGPAWFDFKRKRFWTC